MLPPRAPSLPQPAALRRLHCTGPGQVTSGLPATPVWDSQVQTPRLETAPRTPVFTRAQRGKYRAFGATRPRGRSCPRHPESRGERLRRTRPSPAPVGRPGTQAEVTPPRLPEPPLKSGPGLDHGRFPRGQGPRRPGLAGGARRPALHARPPAPPGSAIRQVCRKTAMAVRPTLPENS